MSNRPKLSDILYSDIHGQMRDGRLRPDARLPSEKELSQQFGVSRPIVREALHRLRAAGLIYSRQGSGSFVAGTGEAAAPRQGITSPGGDSGGGVTSIADVRRIYEFRQALEGGAAFAAALNRTEAHLEAIRREIDAIDRAIQAGELGVQQDRDFHAGIVRATQNRFFEEALASLNVHLTFVIDLSRTVAASQSREHMALVQQEHRLVFDYVRDGNASGAREAMQTHIRNAQDRVFAGIHV